MFSEGMLLYFESCSRESIDNAIMSLAQMRALCHKDIGSKSVRLFGSSQLAYFRSGESA